METHTKRGNYQHGYQIGRLEALKRKDLKEFEYEICKCNNFGGGLVALKTKFVLRRLYVGQRVKSREFIQQLDKHSRLSVKNNFYDSRLTCCFREQSRVTHSDDVTVTQG